MESAAELPTILPPPLAPAAGGSLSSSTLDLEAPTIDERHHHHERAADPNNDGGVGIAVVHNKAAHHVHLDWPMIVMGFCFSWAGAIALQSFQTCAPLSLSVSFHFLCLAMVVAVAALFVSNYISPKFPNRAQVLEHMGVLFGVTAFFFAITVPFSLCLKLIYWTVYALSLLVIFLCIRL